MKVRLYLEKDGPKVNYPMDLLPPATSSKPNSRSNDTFVGPYCANTGNSAEFPQNNDASSNDIGFVVQLFERSAVEKDALGAGKSPEDPDWEVYLRFESPTIECNTETFNKDRDDFSGGSIWTIMPTVTGSECRVAVEKDSNPNVVNIAWLIPQYIIITVAEVMVSVTGLEFAYAQAPKSMKAVIQSFWLLTTCFGNIIDIFLIAAKMGSNQAEEYMILAAIMLGTSLIFVALSIFYYDYVDPAEFENSADEEDEKSKKSSKRSTKNSQKSRKSDVKDDINDTTDL